MVKILATKEHAAAAVDPFGARPCDCDTVTVHITDGDMLGDDIAECPSCGWRLTLRELYKDHAPPSLALPIPED